MFTAVVRITGAGRLEDFRERLRWLMVRDEDAESYTEHHAAGVLEYRFQPRRGIPFPAFTTASADFPELRVEAQWEHGGVRGRAVIENGRLTEQTDASTGAALVEVKVGDQARLELGVTCCQAERDLIGYAVTHDRHTYFRYQVGGGKLTLLDPAEPDATLEDVAFRFVEEWIWYDEEEAALERARYANYGFPVRGANLKSEKLALLRKHEGKYSSLTADGVAVREALVTQWLKQ